MIRLAVSVGFALTTLSACSRTPPCERDVEAYVMAQTFIERQLRSPSTADFPNMGTSGVSVRPTTLTNGECAFVVLTYVDAQNGFGATIRQNFMVTVAPDGDSGSWTQIDIATF